MNKVSSRIRLEKLSPSQLVVLKMRASGKLIKEIAWDLKRSESTIKNHITGIHDKLRCRTLGEIIATYPELADLQVVAAKTTLKSDRLDRLTPRQLCVIKLRASGMPCSKVAAELNMSMETLKSHSKGAFWRLGVSNMAELTHCFSEVLS